MRLRGSVRRATLAGNSKNKLTRVLGVAHRFGVAGNVTLLEIHMAWSARERLFAGGAGDCPRGRHPDELMAGGGFEL